VWRPYSVCRSRMRMYRARRGRAPRAPTRAPGRTQLRWRLVAQRRGTPRPRQHDRQRRPTWSPRTPHAG